PGRFRPARLAGGWDLPSVLDCAARSRSVGAWTSEDVLDRSLGNERLARPQRVVLAQRVSLELLVHQDAAQIGVAFEANSIKVPHEALEPVRALKDGRERRQLWRVARHSALEGQVLNTGRGEEEVRGR